MEFWTKIWISTYVIRKFFTNDGWMLVKEAVEQKRLKAV